MVEHRHVEWDPDTRCILTSPTPIAPVATRRRPRRLWDIRGARGFALAVSGAAVDHRPRVHAPTLRRMDRRKRRGRTAPGPMGDYR